MKPFLKTKKNGFAMVEVMIGLGIVAVMIVAFQSLIIHSVKVARANQSEFQANLYLRELVEIAKALEQSSGGWTKIETASCVSPSKCYFSEQGTSWNIVSGEETMDDISQGGFAYTRSFYIETTGNSYNKKFIATISWFNGTSNRSLTLESYVYQGIY